MRSHVSHRKPASLAVIALAAASLGGCSTLGGNINGSFTCNAPDGVCAPSTTIDDLALAEIEPSAGDFLISPVGPYPANAGDGRLQVASAPVATPAAQHFQLSVVFPAYVDAAGVAHERGSVVAAARLPGRSSDNVELASRAQARPAPGLLSVAQSAPPLAVSVQLPPRIEPDILPDPELALVTRQAGKAPGAIERIKGEVDAALKSDTVTRRAASFRTE